MLTNSQACLEQKQAVPAGSVVRCSMRSELLPNRYDDSIPVKEGRAAVLGVRRLAKNSAGSNCRRLCLVDNLGVALSFGRSWAHNFRLLRQVRILSAISLARNIQLAWRWIPSEYNPVVFG